MEKVQGFFEKNWIWIITLIFTVGVNYATTMINLSNKLDREEARLLIQEELKNRTYTLVDGRVMEIKMSNMQDDISEIKRLLQESGRK
jgi:hypothetical protein